MDTTEKTELLRELHKSLDQRLRPEDVVPKILALGVSHPTLAHFPKGHKYSFMSLDHRRPVDATKALAVASELDFGPNFKFGADDTEAIELWLVEAEKSIGKTFGQNDFKADRLSAKERKAAGIELSRRQYNKRFRLAARLENKLIRLRKDQFKRSLTLASKNCLAHKITWDQFSSDVDTACFIAYYNARANRRSIFTNDSQERPFDRVCEALLSRCQSHPETTSWKAIAYILPRAEVLAHLSEHEKGQLLAEYYEMMRKTSILLEEVFYESDIDEQTMIVKRGNDSTTWNVAAGAWNKLRQGWIELLYSMGFVEVVEKFCPGKVLRLIAADVAYWHRNTGGDLHDDTKVWRELPRPWEVMNGDSICTKKMVEDACRKQQIDPVKSNWSAPSPDRSVAETTPTPELVHGVIVGSPILAKSLKKAGVFSGKPVSEFFDPVLVDTIRLQHYSKVDKRFKNSAEEILRRINEETPEDF